MSRKFSMSSSQEEDERVFRYECPADFVPLQSSCSEKCVLEGGGGGDTELWLIKAPTRFNPSSLANLKVSLSGQEMIQSAGTSSQIYSVLSSRSGPTDLHLFTSSDKKHKSSPCLSGFTGILSISESYGDCSGDQSPIPVPAAPAPSFPPGLKQRFQPFGSSSSVHAPAVSPPKKVKLESEGTEVQPKNKKKKQKEKHSRGETTEVAHIKREEISSERSELLVPELVEEDSRAERKKKKIKKEKERKDNGKDEVAVDARFIVKQEPVDASLDGIETFVKKKKKKKGKDH